MISEKEIAQIGDPLGCSKLYIHGVREDTLRLQKQIMILDTSVRNVLEFMSKYLKIQQEKKDGKRKRTTQRRVQSKKHQLASKMPSRRTKKAKRNSASNRRK